MGNSLREMIILQLVSIALQKSAHTSQRSNWGEATKFIPLLSLFRGFDFSPLNCFPHFLVSVMALRVKT